MQRSEATSFHTTAAVLQLRAGPGDDFKPIAELVRGTTVFLQALSKDERWGRVVADLPTERKEGWVEMAYVEPMTNQPNVPPSNGNKRRATYAAETSRTDFGSQGSTSSSAQESSGSSSIVSDEPLDFAFVIGRAEFAGKVVHPEARKKVTAVQQWLLSVPGPP